MFSLVWKCIFLRYVKHCYLVAVNRMQEKDVSNDTITKQSGPKPQYLSERAALLPFFSYFLPYFYFVISPVDEIHDRMVVFVFLPRVICFKALFSMTLLILCFISFVLYLLKEFIARWWNTIYYYLSNSMW